VKRGTTLKTRTDTLMSIERKMVTHHDVLTWELDRCVGCQICPLTCPKDALSHVPAELQDGRLRQKASVDVDPTKCVFCGMCVPMCPTNAIHLSLNGKEIVPVQDYEAFPQIIESNKFDRETFDWSRKDFVIQNCPTDVISYKAEEDTLKVNHRYCIRCRQCEVASDGAFTVIQPWEGTVELRRELCVEGCLACADICPTRALHIDDAGNLVLADYYCIKCGACMQVCPIKAEYETYEVTFESQGMTFTREGQRLTNATDLPIRVERWRIKHQPVQSAAWIRALIHLADDKAGMVEVDRKRALKRRDLLSALKDGRRFAKDKAE